MSYLTDSNRFIQLRDVFAELYPIMSMAQQVVAQTGMDMNRINFSGTAMEIWHAILIEADRRALVTELLDVALGHFPNNPRLNELAITFQELQWETPKLSLSGKMYSQILEALLDAFRSKMQLAIMVRHKLNQNLDAIADGTNLEETIFSLIEWADANGRVDELISVAYERHSGNSKLKLLMEQLGSTHEMDENISHFTQSKLLVTDTESTSVSGVYIDEKISWKLTLDLNAGDLRDEDIEKILEHLQVISGDRSLSLVEVATGSIVLTLDGSREGYKIIESLYADGKLNELLGLPVKSVSYDNSGSKKAVEVFFSYCHMDEHLRSELVAHLSILQRKQIISNWCDRQIMAGEEWGTKLDERMNSADIILLLVSSDFIASDYCWDVEVEQAMARHQKGSARVIPVILRPVNWMQAPFGMLQALPRDAKPVTVWANQDEAFLNISEGIETVAKQLLGATK